MASERIKRLLRVACAIQSGRASGVDELATLAGVSRRTVFRDLEALAQSGLEYSFDRKRGAYAMDEPALLPMPRLSEAEGTALLLAARHMLSSSLFPDRQAATDASLKLESILPEHVRDRCLSLVRRMAIFHSAEPATDVVREMMPLLQRAIVDRVKLDLTLSVRGGGRAAHARVHPYFLIHVDRRWHLLAFVEKHTQFELIRIDDFVRMQFTSSPFAVDPGFHVDRFFAELQCGRTSKKHHHVTVRFRPGGWTRVLETEWHSTQRITYGQDGSMLFEVDIDRLDDVACWILSFGDAAEVIEPIELRSRIAACAARMSRAYAASDGLSQPASQSA